MSTPLRLVLDTNIVMSALLWQGRPAELLDLGATSLVRLFTSAALVAELEASLAKPRLAARVTAIGLTPTQHASNYASLASLVTPQPLSERASRDADDDRVLACALAATADAVVSGDADLLVLGGFRGMPILRVGECLDVIAALSGGN